MLTKMISVFQVQKNRKHNFFITQETHTHWAVTECHEHFKKRIPLSNDSFKLFESSLIAYIYGVQHDNLMYACKVEWLS
jgi:hypothetical protein